MTAPAPSPDSPKAGGPVDRSGPSKKAIIGWGAGMLLVLGLVVPGAYVFTVHRECSGVLDRMVVNERRRAVARFAGSRTPPPEHAGYSYSAYLTDPDSEPFPSPEMDLYLNFNFLGLLGDQHETVRKLRVYLALPEGLAPRRVEAAYLLSKCGASAVPLLSRLTRSEDSSVAAVAAWALGEIGPEASSGLEALEELLDHEDAGVRANARRAIDRIRREGKTEVNSRPPASPGERRLLAVELEAHVLPCLLYTSPSPRDQRGSRMPSSA